ncbi:Hypothetical Protein CGB_H0020W [Cryptococcus gattii WM276]|uniref:Uncharacterized protein n=1 Tax=Cryptococcus gattii serotype B (strain WM276 / ATCC MYA-4071) TaxID=367775 RepID=E6RA58_CRYGW|nr:Hypothetical Protein CGB_H0020W [Cryptococcus gattii WM276]ADV23719.1 Hypothetical Protein CGB_H0020W [Cryptococcus gattii WM276]
MLNLESFGLSSLFSVEGKVSRQCMAVADVFRLLPGDVGSKDKVDAIVTALEKLEDHVDVLINCAGVNRAWKEEAAKFDNQHNDPDAVEKLLWHGLDDNEFQSTYSINVNGVYFFSTRMVPLLRKGTAPTVIVIASITAMMLQRLPLFIAQVCSLQDSHRKYRLCNRGHAADTLNRFKIRVNTLLPGIFPSEMTGVSAKPDLSDLIETNPQAARAVARCPAGRAGAETEIVGPCLFLASAAGGYMNNARLTIDGGRLMSAGSNDGVRMEDWTYV